MQTFVFNSFKGGTAKTSSVLHIGACLAKFHNKRGLLIDFDSQALSIGLGVGPDSLKTMVPVLQGQGNIQEMIQETSVNGLFLIPANAYLDGIERTPQLGNDPYAHERLRRALKPIEKDKRTRKNSNQKLISVIRNNIRKLIQRKDELNDEDRIALGELLQDLSFLSDRSD